MKIVIEIDETQGSRLKDPKRAPKELKRLVRSVGDQLSWGDQGRPLQDKDGATVGKWLRVD